MSMYKRHIMGVIWTCIWGTLQGVCEHVHEFICLWDPSYFRPNLVVARSPTFSQSKASLLDNVSLWLWKTTIYTYIISVYTIRTFHDYSVTML